MMMHIRFKKSSYDSSDSQRRPCSVEADLNLEGKDMYVYIIIIILYLKMEKHLFETLNNIKERPGIF